MDARRNNKGFTLIELLVVIAIIGMLSSVVLASLNSARAKARDARRIADMKQIANAIELYMSDNARYPAGIAACTGGSYSEPINNDSTFVNALVPTYISSLPSDPKPYTGNPLYGYTYGVSTDGQNYVLLIYPEKSQPAGWCSASAQVSGVDPCNWAASYAACRL